MNASSPFGLDDGVGDGVGVGVGVDDGVGVGVGVDGGVGRVAAVIGQRPCGMHGAGGVDKFLRGDFLTVIGVLGYI